jgi:SAM-dependent methyltransferase
MAMLPIARLPRAVPAGLLRRLTERQLDRLDPAVVERLLPGGIGGSGARAALERLAWDIVYWRFPHLYDALTQGEEIHPALVALCQVDGKTVLDAGAGAGRLSFLCAPTARRVIAMEPSPRLRGLLARKAERQGIKNVEPCDGWFDRVPLKSGSVDVTVSLSALGADDAHGGDRGLAELARVTRPQGRLVFLWPEDPRWFLQRGFQYVRFDGPLNVRFRSLATAKRAARIFYPPAAQAYIEEQQRPEVPFELLGVNPPCDACWRSNPA